MQIANPVLGALKEREFSDVVAENLEKFGYAFIGVNNASDNPEEPTPAYVYTVGLHQRGYPDIFISGNLPQQTAMNLINWVIGFWEKQGKVKLGRINNFLKENSTGIVRAIGLKEVDLSEQSPSEEGWVPGPLKTHLEELEKRFPDVQNRRVVQLLWPDKNNYLPTNENYTADASEHQHLLPWVE